MSDIAFRELGERIREKRIEKGLTQQSLASGKISRNMLSLIENGEANPSLETLLYIADALDTPPAFFLCRNENEAAQYEKIATVTEIRNLFSQGLYRRCSELCLEAPLDEEIASILIESEIISAILEFDAMHFTKSLENLAIAEKVASGMPQFRHNLPEIAFLRSVSDELSVGRLPTAQAVMAADAKHLPIQRKLYLCAVSSYENGTEDERIPITLFGKRTPYRAHLDAKEVIADGDFEAAYSMLSSIPKETLDPVVRFFLMKDEEFCATKTDRFREAYSLSAERQKITEAVSDALKNFR